MSNHDRWLDPPDEYDAFCDCGHRASEHGEDNKPDYDAMKDALEAIVDLPAPLGIGSNRIAEINKMTCLASRGLSICDGSDDCECHAFSESVDEPPDKE